MNEKEIKKILLGKLTDKQQEAVKSPLKRLLVVAGAGSGKTEVMARRVAWWVAIDKIPKDSIVAFTFTDRAAEEMKFRIRQHIQSVTPKEKDTTLGGMYVGTIHGFCLKLLRKLAPDRYHHFDVLDETARLALVYRGYYNVLRLQSLRSALQATKQTTEYDTIDTFLKGYDLLNEYDVLDVKLPSSIPPLSFESEAEWCKQAKLETKVGKTEIARAFADCAGRYYAYLHYRRFLDFSTSQSELSRLLNREQNQLQKVREKINRLVVDEVQDVNPVQDVIIRYILGEDGHLTAVGDHRQAIYAWRGGRVEIMAKLFDELKKSKNTDVIELQENFRSTPRIIKLANKWADTINPVFTMSSPQMKHGNEKRNDYDQSHVGVFEFPTHEDETEWIAKQIMKLVKTNEGNGASHDTLEGERGLTFADIAILIRSSTDARQYMTALEKQGIPAVFRAGPDLFSQPEILLFLGLLAHIAGIDEFYGSIKRADSLPSRIKKTLDCSPQVKTVIRKACTELKKINIPTIPGCANRLIKAAELIRNKITGMEPTTVAQTEEMNSSGLKTWLKGTKTKPRRIFPQRLFHLLLGESQVGEWQSTARGRAALFHLGQFSALIKGIETPGWTDYNDFKSQITGLCTWGSHKARTEEAPLLVEPEAVTIGTIHSAKGLEYAAVFLADVKAHRFPSSRAKSDPGLPFDGPILNIIDPSRLKDSDNYDDERRLMYVALTRAERYLFVTSPVETKQGPRRSKFFKDISPLVQSVSGVQGSSTTPVLLKLRHLKSEYKRDIRLTTSFSDLRYYIECPYDFYLRKVLGFAPTINQAFGYGRGIHNLLRAIHNEPKEWAKLVDDPLLSQKIEDDLIHGRGLFYLRYTTGSKPGDPLYQLRKKALEIIKDYIVDYKHELRNLEFEPEREFETLIEDAQVLVTGVIDLIKLEDPPRVTLVDFKSGDPESDIAVNLDSEEMKLQISLYGLAAKKELEYEPEKGLVRYLGERNPEDRELSVNLDENSLAQARDTVIDITRKIRNREFETGPHRKPRDPKKQTRCMECDYQVFCGQPKAKEYRESSS